MTAVRTFTSSSLPPRERGVEFGRAHAERVRRSVAGYAHLFARRGGPGFDARRWARELREAIGDVDPDALAEVAGIAEGAGLDELDLVSLNARTELLAKADPYGDRECSAVLVTPADAPAYGVQTWDWYASMAETWLRWRVPLPDGQWLETVTEYGMLAKIGVNSHGVGVLLTMLHHEADANDRTGFPVHLLSRRVLAHATSSDEAVALCQGTKVCASTSLTVLDPGHGATVELFPDGPGVLEPTNGLLVRTNHFVTDAGRDGCLTDERDPSTRIRLDRLDGVLRASPPGGPEDVLAAMVHHHPLGGVCRHPEQDWEPWERTATLATVVVETDPPGLEVLAGGPCGRPVSLGRG